MYRNEAEVGRAIRAWSEESGRDRREEIFVTTKVIQNSHGYDSTLKVVEESLVKLGLCVYALLFQTSAFVLTKMLLHVVSIYRPLSYSQSIVGEDQAPRDLPCTA